MPVQKPFIRVRDKVTKHQYDIRRESFNEAKHEPVKRAKDSWHARRPKYFVPLRTPKTSTTEVDQGNSPAGD